MFMLPTSAFAQIIDQQFELKPADSEACKTDNSSRACLALILQQVQKIGVPNGSSYESGTLGEQNYGPYTTDSKSHLLAPIPVPMGQVSIAHGKAQFDFDQDGDLAGVSISVDQRSARIVYKAAF